MYLRGRVLLSINISIDFLNTCSISIGKIEGGHHLHECGNRGHKWVFP